MAGKFSLSLFPTSTTISLFKNESEVCGGKESPAEWAAPPMSHSTPRFDPSVFRLIRFPNAHNNFSPI